MPSVKINYNCGEFLPGKIRVGDKIVPPPVVNKIPKYPICCNEIPGRPSIPRPPLDEWVCICGAACADDPSQCLEGRGCIKKRNVPPGVRHGRVFDTFLDCVTFGFGEAPCWKCGVKCTETTVPCPPPRPDLPRQIIRQCVACPPAREQTGPCAQYPSLRECAIYCRTENRNCPGGPITPVIIRPPDIVPIVRPVTPVVVRGPITPTPYYKCVSRIEYCPPPFQNTPKRLRQGCELCWTDLGNGTGRLPDGSIGPRPNDCNLTSQQCATRGGANETPCRDVTYNVCPIAGPITPIGTRPVVTPITPVVIDPPRPPIAISITPINVIPEDPPIVIAIDGRVIGVDDGGGNRQREGTGSQILSLLASNTNLLGQTIDLSVGVTRNQLFEESRKVRTIEISRESKRKFVSSSTKDTDSIYHEKYNLFQHNPENTTKLVTNARWLNIFKPVVPEEVAYILNIAGSRNTWNEYAYTQLTKEKVLVSLRYELLKALSNLHFVNGKVIPVDHFVETIRFLMTTNRLDEFDDSYFTNLYAKQRNDEYLEINDFGTQGLREQAALGLISYEATNSDPFQQDDEISKVLLLRSKRLNTDIEANIPIERLNGVVQPVPIQDAGLEVVALLDQGLPVIDEVTQTTSYVQYGPGHGYYFSATLEDGSVVPLITDNQLSSTYYLSPALRDTTLELLGKDPAVRFVSESISNLSEFESYTTGTPLVPMYMKLRLNSIGDMERSNPLSREVSGIYDLIDSPESIDEHLREYGFSVSKVFVDFDDPFLRYVQDSETVTFYQSDISFNGMYPNKANAGNSILSRNIAFAVIFVPVRGSKFNPFGGRSKLINYTSPYSRELQVINDINSTTDREIYNSVKQDLLVEKEGVFKIGMLETNNAQNVSFTYQTSGFDYSGLYFSGSQYISEQPSKTYPITNRLVNQVIETNISGTYGLSGITWWDIYRRLSADEMAKISFEIPKTYLDKLANGLRGYKIKYVLQRDNVTEGSMLGDTIDSVIIETTDRNVNSQNII